MSEARQSRAAVVRVKGVSFHYLQFLWTGVGQIRQQQAQGNFSGAMALMVTFIDYLPDSIKDEFREKARLIQQSMLLIRSGRLPQIVAIPDFFIRGIYRNRLLQVYCSEAFQDFTDSLTSELNKLGYMENLKMVQEGEVDAPSWLDMQKKLKGRRKGKKKERQSSPTGTID